MRILNKILGRDHTSEESLSGELENISKPNRYGIDDTYKNCQTSLDDRDYKIGTLWMMESAKQGLYGILYSRK